MNAGQREARASGVDPGLVAGDHARVLQPPHPVGDRGRGQVDLAAELVERQATVLLELGEDAPVGAVERSAHLQTVAPEHVTIARRSATNACDRPFSAAPLLRTSNAWHWHGTSPHRGRPGDVGTVRRRRPEQRGHRHDQRGGRTGRGRRPGAGLGRGARHRGRRRHRARRPPGHLVTHRAGTPTALRLGYLASTLGAAAGARRRAARQRRGCWSAPCS